MATARVVVLLMRPALRVAETVDCWTGVTREQCCDAKYGPRGNPGCWDTVFTFEVCCVFLDGAPRPPALAVAPEGGYPTCIARDMALRHLGEHAIFADMSSHGSAGCFQNDCKLTDKFNAKDRGICARLCAELEECTHWSFGMQDGATKCFLRKSDEGRQKAPGWESGVKACAPPPLPNAFAALATADSEGLVACNGGKSEACPDALPAINTWRFAIKHLTQAVEGRVDENTLNHVNQIAKDSENLANSINAEFRPSDADFPRVVYNNRLIFNSLKGWLVTLPRVELNATDGSLPTPLRTGKLCGPTSCYDS